MSSPAYRTTLLFSWSHRVTAVLCHTLTNDGLVVMGSWFNTNSLLLFQVMLIHNLFQSKISQVRNCVTWLPCRGRVVIGSLLVYQVIGAGSDPVASTIVLIDSARSIGTDQCRWIKFARGSLGEIRGSFQSIGDLQSRLFEAFMDIADCHLHMTR